MIGVTLTTPLGNETILRAMRYSGLVRVAGADYFDPRSRDLPMLRRGIFHMMSHGLFAFALLLF